MKALARRILSICFAAVICAGVGTVLHFARERRHVATCSALDVQICEKYHFVSEQQIKRSIEKGYGIFLGRRLDSLGLARIEKVVDEESAVKKSQVWVTPDGVLHVSIVQREPLIRFQKGDTGFYADETGCIFPLQKNYTSSVMVVDGFLPLNVSAGYKGKPATEKERAWMKKITDLVLYMQKSKVWEDNIVQISVTEGGDLVMVPREGSERFIFGSPDQVKAKFKRMEKYYTSIRGAVMEDVTYRSVNVKYNGQIICRR